MGYHYRRRRWDVEVKRVSIDVGVFKVYLVNFSVSSNLTVGRESEGKRFFIISLTRQPSGTDIQLVGTHSFYPHRLHLRPVHD